MKILKFTLITFLAVVILFFAMALLLPSVNYIERSITIHAPVEKVYSSFSNIKEWNSVSLLQKDAAVKYFPDSIIQFERVNKDIGKTVYVTVKFSGNVDEAVVTLIYETPLPLVMRMMTSKIEETTVPLMEESLALQKKSIEAINQ
ncbi:MAG: hypothetical protein ABI772_02110 [Bacteroidota bacterium]